VKGVTDALRRLYGVATIQVDLQSNRVHLTPAPDAELDLAAIPAAIRRAGFTPAEMELTARGTFVTRGNEGVFRIRGWTSELSVLGTAARPSGEVELHARVSFTDGITLVPFEER
jgi:copper chaperone CopZ